MVWRDSLYKGEQSMNIGIDKIGFFVPPTALDMETLAVARGVEPAKYTIGIGQSTMAVAPVTQDIVTLAATAALSIIDDDDRESIDMVLFGTETGIDQSKSGAVYLQRLLNLSHHVRCVELKHACYGATAALQLAKGHIALNPTSKVLVIASDIAKYGLNSGGEPTQGAGAVAMIVSANPRLLVLDQETSLFSDDVMDFWRPNHEDYPIVDGKFSNEQYIRFFAEVWNDYQAKTNAQFSDFDAICFHLPYTKMGMKAFKPFLEEMSEEEQERFTARYQEAAVYNRQVGNIYTGSLFLSFISLLENSSALVAGDRIGFFSYGSGAVGEFFAGELVEGFENQLNIAEHKALLENRKMLTVEEYEEIFTEVVNASGEQTFTREDDSSITLTAVVNHQRQYTIK